MCRESGLSVAQLMMKNELTWRDAGEIAGGLDRIWQVMQDCVSRGCGINYPEADGELPGPLRVRRRAPELYRNLTQRAERTLSDPLSVMDWVNPVSYTHLDVYRRQALLTRWLPKRTDPNDPARPQYLDAWAHDVPAVALGNAAREALRMADKLQLSLIHI